MSPACLGPAPACLFSVRHSRLTPALPAAPPTPSGSSGTPAPPAPQTATTVNVGGTTVTTTTGGSAPDTVVVQAPGASVSVSVPTVTKVTAFDGYLDNCQARLLPHPRPCLACGLLQSRADTRVALQTVVGSVPQADGNFDRNNNYTSVITDGVSNMTTQVANLLAGQVAYVIPASKGAPCLASSALVRTPTPATEA